MKDKLDKRIDEALAESLNSLTNKYMEKAYKILEDIGTAPAGSIFVRGDILNGKPLFYPQAEETDFYWLKDSAKGDNHFLPKAVFSGTDVKCEAVNL